MTITSHLTTNPSTRTPLTGSSRLAALLDVLGLGVRPPTRRRAPRPVPSREGDLPDGYRRVEPTELRGPEPLHMTDAVLGHIRDTVGVRPAEEGGMLGGPRARGVVTRYHFDETARRTTATYTPDDALLNQLLRKSWNPAGINLLGFVHSHPRSYWRPSGGDMVYAERILAAIPAMDRIVLPIAQTRPDTGAFALHTFVATRTAGTTTLDRVPLVVVPETLEIPTLGDAAFDRVHQAYDLAATAATRLVIVGVGGAAAFAESMARAGVGEIVLIDPDVVDLPNIATQHTYRRDVGRAKVDAIAERILDVNPHCRVVGVQAYLDDLDDDMVGRLVHRPLPGSRHTGPEATILCGFTDSFWAQARVNRLALNLGVPMVAAQVYASGQGVEASFHVPGWSHACGRCVLGSRYRAHLDRGYANTITSHGTPLWATERLNELKAQIVLAIIHGVTPAADTEHPARLRYRRLLERIATRNLVQVRLDPDASFPAFARALAGADVDRVVTDDTLWLPQAPEHPDTGYVACGDCGGTGDLTACVGTLTDTRLTSPAGGTIRPPSRGSGRGVDGDC